MDLSFSVIFALFLSFPSTSIPSGAPSLGLKLYSNYIASDTIILNNSETCLFEINIGDFYIIFILYYIVILYYTPFHPHPYGFIPPQHFILDCDVYGKNCSIIKIVL